MRLGISWRIDSADPGCVVLNQVVPGSPAALAGLRLNDRIYRIGEREVSEFETVSAESFFENRKVSLLVERQGFLRTVEIDIPPAP